jgi:hypothetical protein
MALALRFEQLVSSGEIASYRAYGAGLREPGARNAGHEFARAGSGPAGIDRALAAGGGISTTAGTATITNSVINANQVNSSGTTLGGGINCENSTLSLTNCTVNANQANGTTALGGGTYALNSTVTVTDSTVNGNRANGSVLGDGGGIYSFNSVLNLMGT